MRSGGLCGKQGLDSQSRDLALETRQWLTFLHLSSRSSKSCPRKAPRKFPYYVPTSHPTKSGPDQGLQFLNLLSTSSATSHTGEEAWELTSAGLREAHPPTRPRFIPVRKGGGVTGRRRSEVTELGSRGRRRGRAPSGSGAQAGERAICSRTAL